MIELQGESVITGVARGKLLASSEPLSFWGGYDQKTGEIIDRRHPLSGEHGKDTILAVPFTRGSSTTTAILLESIRAGVAPAALITTGADTFLMLASVAADEMYGTPVPIVSLTAADYATLVARFKLDESVTAYVKNNGVVTIE